VNKVAFFLPSLAGGGAERVCVNLAGGFLQRGLEVDFVLVRAEGPLLQAVPSGARVIDLSARRTLAALLPLAAYLRREKPYALIAAPDHANLVALWANQLSGSRSRLVLTTHNFLSIVVRRARKVQESLYPLLLRLFYKYAFALVAVSAGAADDLAHLTGIRREHIRVIHNPVALPDPAALRAASPGHPWFAEGEPPVILAAGRLTAQKDYPTLLRAFASVRSRRPARLVILGEGEERARLLELAAELGIRADVDLPGFTDHPYPLMARCRVFVLSSAWEGFGIVLAEALACGAQVVATDCPSGPAEILEGGKYGRLVPVGDVDALANAIEAALDQPFPIEKLRARARSFSVETVTDQYLRLLGLA
jgi:glycosyltransferase involved in cell wall biosynthesis